MLEALLGPPIWRTVNRGSPILFSRRVNGHFCFTWNVNEGLFFPWFVNLYISVLGKLVFDFFVIRELMHSLSRDFWTNNFCENNFSLFFGDFGAIKARKLHQTRCKTCPWFDELADGGLRTNHSNSNLEGLESAIMDKSREPEESWDKFALLAFLRTRQTLIQPLLPNLAPTPHTMLKTTTCNFFWFPGKIVFDGRGKVTRL